MTVDTITGRTYPVPVSLMLSLPDHRSRNHILTYVRALEEAEQERLRVKAERDRLRSHRYSAEWDQDPYVHDTLNAARRQLALDLTAGHQPGYWAKACVECDRTKPTAVHQCRSCGRYNTRRGQP